MITAIRQIHIVDKDKEQIGDLVFDTQIISISPNFKGKIDKEIDGRQLWVFPGFVDPHVHFRTPGMEHKEDFKSGGEAALAGGITMVFDMPNTIPPVFSVAILEQKKTHINSISPIRFGVFICGNENNIEEIKNANNIPAVKLFLNDTTGHLLLENRTAWKAIFSTGKRITLHAEGDTFLEAIHIWEKAGRPCSIHLAHMTLEKELNEIKRLKQNPLSQNLISCEVCPHHLLFNQEDASVNPLLRMKPELATEKDRLSLWQGIQDGWIDCFATDHAPHLIHEKQQTPPAFGVPGVETLFPLLYTVWKQKKWDMKKLSAMMTYNAQEIYGVTNKTGLFRPSFDADFTIINPDEQFVLQASHLHSKCLWTPFENYAVYGKIKATYIQGNLLYDGEQFYPNPLNNKEVSFHHT